MSDSVGVSRPLLRPRPGPGDAVAGLVTLPGVELDDRRPPASSGTGPTGRGWLVFSGFLLASVRRSLACRRHVRAAAIPIREAATRVWPRRVLGWWPHAITNGVNPLHPTVVWAPTGVNMAWVTGLPGPSLAAWPITALFGPVVSLNTSCCCSHPRLRRGPRTCSARK